MLRGFLHACCKAPWRGAPRGCSVNVVRAHHASHFTKVAALTSFLRTASSSNRCSNCARSHCRLAVDGDKACLPWLACVWVTAGV